MAKGGQCRNGPHKNTQLTEGRQLRIQKRSNKRRQHGQTDVMNAASTGNKLESFCSSQARHRRAFSRKSSSTGERRRQTYGWMNGEDDDVFLETTPQILTIPDPPHLVLHPHGVVGLAKAGPLVAQDRQKAKELPTESASVSSHPQQEACPVELLTPSLQ